MRKRIVLGGVVVLLGLLVVPVLIKQAIPREKRALQGAKLADTKYKEVTFTNRVQNIELAGMLFLPEGAGPFPGVVIIHGAGSSRRDNAWYLTMTAYLRENGIAVLLPDKRGCVSSTGDWRTASFPDLATDTLAAIAYLREFHGDRISRIGVLGGSQGGQVAPIVASQSNDVAFAVNLVGSAVPFYEALVFEENNNIREMGVLPGFSNVISRLSSLYIRTIKQKEFWNAIGNYDPIPYWKKVNAPALIMYGEIDTNTPTKRSAERLQAIDKPNIRLITYAGSGHPLEDPIGAGDALIRREALGEMRDFILAATQSG